jgi:hypothetical protein
LDAAAKRNFTDKFLREVEVVMAAVLEGLKAKIHCPMCTRTIEGLAVPEVRLGRSRLRVMPGQKCSRCSASLDAGYVLELLPETEQVQAKGKHRAA